MSFMFEGIISNTPEGQKVIEPVWITICSLIGLSQCHDNDNLLALTNREVRGAFEEFLLPAKTDRTRAHLVLAGKICTVSYKSVQVSTVHAIFRLIFCHCAVCLYRSSVGTG